MPSVSLHAFEGRLYRAALSLFPAAFRRDHGDEMARDFDEARREAAGSGRAVWLLRCGMALDFVRALAVQWVRTGLPVIALTSILLSLLIAGGLAAVVRSVSSIRIPAGIEHDDMVIVLFMVQISIVLIAMTILISLWVGRLTRPGRR
jgi:hypothetical protein